MKVDTFLDSYSDMSAEDPEYIHEYLVEEGVDIDGFRTRLLDILSKKEAELKLEKGSVPKSAYEKLKFSMQELIRNLKLRI